MLVTEKLSPSERKDILSMIDELQSGRMEQRMKRLTEVKVVGATCASTVFSILESSYFVSKKQPHLPTNKTVSQAVRFQLLFWMSAPR